MDRFNAYLKLYSDTTVSDQLTSVKKSNLYSIIISLGFFSFLGFESAFFHGASYFNLFKPKKEIIENDHQSDKLTRDQIIISTYLDDPFADELPLSNLDDIFINQHKLMPPLPDPGGVSGAAAWFKSNSGLSATTEGAAVSSWGNAGGSAYTVIQATGTKQPLYRNNNTDNINFNPVVDFDGIDDELNNVAGILGSANYTNSSVFIVSRSDEIKDQTLVHEQTLGGPHFLFHNPWVDGYIHWDGSLALHGDILWEPHTFGQVIIMTA